MERYKSYIDYETFPIESHRVGVSLLLPFQASPAMSANSCWNNSNIFLFSIFQIHNFNIMSSIWQPFAVPFW